MKILYVAHMRLPTERAHGYATMKLCEAFAQQGNDVTLLVPEKRSEALVADPFAYYGIEPVFRIARAPASDFLGATEGRGNIAFWIDTLSFALIVRLRYFSELSRADLIYVRDYRLAAFLPRRRLAIELHELPRRIRAARRALLRAFRIVSISNGLQEDAAQLVPLGTEILVAPDAVDIAKFSALESRQTARRALDLPESGLVALYTGHFYGWKGADVFAESAAFLPEVTCVLVGGVDTELAVFRETYARTGNVRVVPFQAPSRVRTYLAAADVLVLPNRGGSALSARYTSPLKLFEYMATGRPIVASDLPSIREVLSEQDAYFVAADDSRALARGITEALADPHASERAARARERVEGFSWDERARRILAFCSGNIESHATARI